MNPLYQQINSQPNGQNAFMARLQQFKKQFNGDPQQMIQQMLNSGKISQQQYNNAVQQANQIAKMMGISK